MGSNSLTLAPAPRSEAAERVREEVRAFLAEELAAGSFSTHGDTWLSGVAPAFSRKLDERGWLGMTWPKQYGGHERSAMERYAVTAELAFERSGPERFLSTYPLLAEFGRRACDTGDRAQLATLGRLSARLLALRQLSLRIAAARDRGELPDTPAALVKDVGTTFEADVADEIRRVVEVTPSLDAPDPLGRALAEAQLHQPAFTLRGGTNEILRGIVARGLGLR